MKYKKQIIILLVSVMLYILFNAVYNKFVLKTSETKIFVLNCDIKKGDSINIDNVDVLNVKSKDVQEKYINDLTSVSSLVVKSNLRKGKVISLEDFIKKDELVFPKNEVISLKLTNLNNSLSNTVKKGDIVNIYYTGKKEFANDVLKKFDVSNVMSGGNLGYITIKILSKKEVLGIYDKNGVEVKNNGNGESIIDTVLIEIEEKDAIVLDNLKEYGDFSLSLVE